MKAMKLLVLTLSLLMLSTALWGQNEPIPPKLEWNGAEGTYVWNEDGSIEVRDGELIMTSGIVESQSNITDEEMIIVVQNPYVGDGKGQFGPYMRKLQSGAHGEFRIVGRGKNFGNDRARKYDMNFTSNDHLLFGKRGNPSHTDQFLRQKENWNAYSYYAHGYSTTKTHIKSDDFTHLFRRPKSATWWDTLEDLAFGALILAVVVLGGAAVVAAIELVSVTGALADIGAFIFYFTNALNTLGWTALLGIAATIGIVEEVVLTATTGPDSGYVHRKQVISTDMTTLIPLKYDPADTETKRNINADIDKMLNVKVPCQNPQFADRDCHKPNMMAVGAMAKVKNAHLAYVKYPGSIYEKTTPYELFFKPLYRPPLKGKVLLASEGTVTMNPTSSVFSNLQQHLPKTVAQVTEEQILYIDFQEYEEERTFLYLVGKGSEAPAGLGQNYYHDLGEYGTLNNEVYHLYRIDPAEFDGESFSLTVDATGPFIAGDNLERDDSNVRLFKNENYQFGGIVHSKLGDKIRIEVDKSVAANADDLQIDGLPGVWVARFGWDVMYQRTESFRPGEYHPFLGFDSQVHSVFLRRFEDYFKPDGQGGYQLTIADWEDKGDHWSWEYTVQARMDKDKTVFEPEIDWEVAKITGEEIPEKPGEFYQSTQRHDQRIGQMMYLLNRFDDNGGHETFNADGINSTFQTFNGQDDFFMQCDPDEFMYLQRLGTHVEAGDMGLKLPKIKKDNNTQPEPWHPLLPQEMPGNPAPYKNNLALSYMVTAYQRNQSGDGSYPTYRGFEIEDKGVNIKNDGTRCLGRADCFYKIDASEGSDYQGYEHNAAPGKVTIYKKGASTLEELKTWSVQSNSPQAKDYGFYGSLIGTEWPAQYEKQVPYTFLGLDGLADEELQKFSMALEYEGHFGYLERETRKLADLPIADRQVISTNGAWTEKFDIQGWGTYNLSVLYKDCLGCDSVVVAGKELNEIQLRFLAVNIKDGSNIINLDGSRGDGYFWYMQDSRKNDPNVKPKYGEKPDVYGREYTITNGSTLNFSILDADPHTFRPDGIEFYKSNRSKSKRIPNDSLSGPNGYVQWYIRNVSEDPTAFTESSQINIGSGKEASYTFGTNGTYTVVVLYRDVDDYKNGQTREVKHLINVVDYNGESSGSEEPTRGAISIYNLSDDQKQWLKDANLSDSDGNPIDNNDIDNNYKIASVEHILSKYTYGEPDARPAKGTYDKENDFAAKFQWYINRGGSNLDPYAPVDIPILSQNSPTSNPLLDFRESFPVDWIRHTPGTSIQDKNIDPSRVIEVTDGTNWILEGDPDVVNIHNRWESLFANSPEAWNLRFAWIATTKFHGYQIRNNIKSIIKLPKLFDNSHGAFAGTGNSGYTKEAYEAAVEFPVPVTEPDGLTDVVKSKQKFYYDLAHGRKLLFIPEENTSLHVRNVFTPANGTGVDNHIAGKAISVAGNRSAMENDPLTGSKDLVVYPNASSGTFNLDFGLEQASDVELEVAALSGRIVFDQKLSLNKGTHNIEITLPGDVAKGVYVLRMRSTEISESRTIRVE